MHRHAILFRYDSPFFIDVLKDAWMTLISFSFPPEQLVGSKYHNQNPDVRV